MTTPVASRTVGIDPTPSSSEPIAFSRLVRVEWAKATDTRAARWLLVLVAAGHAAAAKQMKGGFGGMLSVRVKGGERAAIATAARVDLWKRATSLGGVESLIEHRASIAGAGTPCPPDLLRLSVGVEESSDLFDDLDQALKRAHNA